MLIKSTDEQFYVSLSGWAPADIWSPAAVLLSGKHVSVVSNDAAAGGAGLGGSSGVASVVLEEVASRRLPKSSVGSVFARHVVGWLSGAVGSAAVGDAADGIESHHTDASRGFLCATWAR